MDFRAIFMLTLAGLVICALGSPVTQVPEEQDAAPKKPVSYKFKIKEDGEEVEEDVTIDEEKQTETDHVPAHGDKEEVDVITDFNRNISLFRLPAQRMCLLGPLNKDQKSLKEVVAELNKKDKDSESSQSNTITKKYHGQKQLEDRSFLSPEMAALCAQYPIYELEEGLGSSRGKRSCCYYRCYYVEFCYGCPRRCCLYRYCDCVSCPSYYGSYGQNIPV